MNIDKDYLVNRFLSYAKIDTQSDSASASIPSTDTQIPFARIVAEDCRKIGLSNVKIDQYGYLTATLPSNMDSEVPVLGFMAHMDIVPFDSNFEIKPNIINDYDGKDIVLSNGLVLSPNEFPHLKDYIGKSLITTDGNTILGADDKAGIAEIMTAVKYLQEHPEIKHGEVKIAFTPDEEIGTGMNNFDAEGFGAKFAYTVDSEGFGCLNYETFNAAKAKITITGKNIHTGTAKGIMINAALVAAELTMRIPEDQLPSTTEGYEGFYHLDSITGNVDKAVINFIIRDHDKEKFDLKKKFIQEIRNDINVKYGNIAEIELEDQYYNMAEKINEKPEVLALAKDAMAQLGIEAVIEPVRGGTDGAKLTYMGIPCPNIFTGGHNAHGPYEYICIESMVEASKVIITMIQLAAAK